MIDYKFENRNLVRFYAKGTSKELCVELLLLINTLYNGIRQSENATAAEAFKADLIDAVSCPDQRVWARRDRNGTYMAIIDPRGHKPPP